MNWKHVKALLIILLVSVNCLLGYFIYSSYSDTAFTDSSTAQRTAALLSESGIEISPALLAVKNDTAKSFYTPYDREEYLMSVAAFLFDEVPKGAFLLPDGIRAESADGSTAYLGNDMSVNFAIAGTDSTAFSKATAADGETAKTVRETAESLLGYSDGSLASSAVYSCDGIFLVTVSQKENGIPLAGFDCTFGIRDGKIVYASGKHFFGVFDKENESPLLNRVNILLSEKSRGKQGRVVGINLCYILYEDTKLGILRLSPAYSVAYKNGDTSIIDAKSAELFE